MSRNDLPNPNAPNFGQRLREAVMTYLGRQGDPLDRGVTLRDLIEGGIARLRPGYTAGQAAASGGALPIAPEVSTEEPDLTPPPTPTGFGVSAAISHVFIEHDTPAYLQGHGHLRTRVYGKTVALGDPLPVFADAVEIIQFTGNIHAHPSNPATTWRLWIKWESVDGVLSVSPAGGTNGLAVTTGQDVSTMVQAMTGEGKPFTVLTEPTVIGGVTFPAGIYSTLAFIQDLQVTNAKIAALAVDSAQIANGAIVTAKIGNAQVTDAKIDTIDAGKITTGLLSADRIDAGAITAAKIDSRGLSIKDANGNIILAAGTPLDYANVGGTKPPADADKTAANTAAGIANQGAFATISQITGTNVSTYIADAAIKNAQIADAEIELAKIKTATITSLSALSANIGTVTAGQLQNGPSATTFLNLNATGSQDVFSAGNGKSRITADGNAFFTAALAQGQWTGSIVLAEQRQFYEDYGGDAGGAYYWATVYPAQTFEIDTGFNLSRNERFDRTLSARVGDNQIGGTVAVTFNQLNQPGGTYCGTVQVEMDFALRLPLAANGADPILSQMPYGYDPVTNAVYSRVVLIVRVRLLDNPTNRTSMNLTSLKWTLDTVG